MIKLTSLIKSSILKVCLISFSLISCSTNNVLKNKIEKNLKKSELTVDLKLINKFASLSLECIDKKYPYKPGVVLYKKEDLEEPKNRHPIFYGCYDWHSAAHGHWALVKILSTYPDTSLKPEILKKLKKHFTRNNFKKEARFFSKKTAKTFERPYGIAWFLRLIEELDKSQNPVVKTWRESAKPLEKILVEKMIKYFKTFRYPSRVGAHANSAFSMAHAWDYSIQTKNIKLQNAIRKTADEWFLADKECPIHIEPSGGDFVSPCLAVAHLMAKIKPQKTFLHWFDNYMPSPFKKKNQQFFFPPITKDIKDPVAGHLVGLTFQRTWSFKSIIAQLPEDHKYRKLFTVSRKLHLQSGIEQMFDTGYGGTHWLASFVLHAIL